MAVFCQLFGSVRDCMQECTRSCRLGHNQKWQWNLTPLPFLGPLSLRALCRRLLLQSCSNCCYVGLPVKGSSFVPMCCLEKPLYNHMVVVLLLLSQETVNVVSFGIYECKPMQYTTVPHSRLRMSPRYCKHWPPTILTSSARYTSTVHWYVLCRQTWKTCSK